MFHKLYYTRKEKKGMLSLFVLLTLVIGYRLISNLYHPEPAVAAERHWNEPMNKEGAPVMSSKLRKRKCDLPDTLRFDPNTAQLEDWKFIGLSSKQAQVIVNYRKRGGIFFKKSDVKRMYTLDSLVYKCLEPHLIFPEATQRLWKRIELNKAEWKALVAIRDIGEKRAQRILKYRDLLGGYVKLDQLKEVYGLPDSLVVEVQKNCVLKTNQIELLDVNNGTMKALAKHPYISWNLARSIVKYREQHGAYTKKEDLLELDLLNAELYSKIAPYLTLSNVGK